MLYFFITFSILGINLWSEKLRFRTILEPAISEWKVVEEDILACGGFHKCQIKYRKNNPTF